MIKKERHLYEFGPFRIDPDHRLLLRESQPVPVQPKAFDILLVLVLSNEKVVLKEELMKTVWPDTFVEESNLAQHIFVLRKTLGDAVGENRYIVTVPGRGYRFAGEVRAVVAEVPERPELEIKGELDVREGRLATEAKEEKEILVASRSLTRVVIETEQNKGFHFWAGAGAMLVVVLLVLGLYWRSHRKPKLTGKDTIVLGDFANSTGDPVFDGTLKTALSVALDQSPFLNALSERRVAMTLQRMTLASATKLTPEVAREVCQRTSSKAYIAGSIASLGSQYVLALEAVNCENGDTLVQEQMTAPAKEKVLSVLGEAAAKLRAELGESLTTVRKFDVPLAEATTPSLEALQAYSLAYKALFNRDPAAALPYSQHAIELDPDFAMAYLQMGITYFSLGELARASECYAKAFQLRQRASEWEKLIIEANYYGYTTGELDKGVQTFQEEIDTYSRGIHAYDGLTSLYEQKGEYEKAVEAAQTLVRVDPDDTFVYNHLALDELHLQHFSQTRQIVAQAQARKLDGFTLHSVLYTIAFLGADSTGMAEQQSWFAGQAAYENYGLALASDTEAYAGHVSKARELTLQAVDSAIRADNKEGGAVYRANEAVQQAAYGNAAAAQGTAAKALELAPESPGVDAETALAFAMIGATARAESLVQSLDKRFPLDTQMQSLWLPTIRAQVALSRRKPDVALSALPVPSPIEFANIPFVINTSCLYQTYVRGEAYLAAGKGVAAATEFQKIIDHGGIVWNCWTGALARLGVARANALQSKTSQGADADTARGRAQTAYKDFLTLWKDADSDIPILKEAKSEYAKLQ